MARYMLPNTHRKDLNKIEEIKEVAENPLEYAREVPKPELKVGNQNPKFLCHLSLYCYCWVLFF